MSSNFKLLMKWIISIIAILGLLYAYVSFGSKRSKIESAQEMIDTTLPKFAEDWNWTQFASDSVFQLTDKNDGTIETFAELTEGSGPLKKYLRSKYKGAINIRVQKVLTPALVFNVEFMGENGFTSIDVSVIQEGNRWKYAGILIEKVPKPKPES